MLGSRTPCSIPGRRPPPATALFTDFRNSATRPPIDDCQPSNHDSDVFSIMTTISHVPTAYRNLFR